MDGLYHVPVLLDEVLEGLAPERGGVFYDATVGGGGHSLAILSSSENVRLIGTDRDGEAIEEARRRLAPFEGRFSLYRSDYRNFERVLDEAGADKLDGVLADLGISSHQIDEKERGFSYRTPDAPLDMRMDRDAPLTAETVVNDYPEEELVRILREYGEEPFAPAIARAISAERARGRISTCGKLASVVENAIPPKFRSAACARQTFQAVRIEVNDELSGLGECVERMVKRLAPGGRICIVTFHSLEDRIVKQRFAKLNADCVCPKNFPVCVCGKRREIELVNKKPIVASEEERERNPRSKSAKLRIARKV